MSLKYPGANPRVRLPVSKRAPVESDGCLHNSEHDGMEGSVRRRRKQSGADFCPPDQSKELESQSSPSPKTQLAKVCLVRLRFSAPKWFAMERKTQKRVRNSTVTRSCEWPQKGLSAAAAVELRREVSRMCVAHLLVFALARSEELRAETPCSSLGQSQDANTTSDGQKDSLAPGKATSLNAPAAKHTVCGLSDSP
ncbi:hypothetical protein SUNI508_10793 [Seiridium unicorne]|uniref:Uncharacterized protein n=1 Tax=Seiridium unicorne TaxID=138068 RepID=A0ABR2UJQ5_9PEZI